jgi:hypothetical protein
LMRPCAAAAPVGVGDVEVVDLRPGDQLKGGRSGRPAARPSGPSAPRGSGRSGPRSMFQSATARKIRIAAVRNAQRRRGSTWPRWHAAALAPRAAWSARGGGFGWATASVKSSPPDASPRAMIRAA